MECEKWCHPDFKDEETEADDAFPWFLQSHPSHAFGQVLQPGPLCCPSSPCAGRWPKPRAFIRSPPVATSLHLVVTFWLDKLKTLTSDIHFFLLKLGFPSPSFLSQRKADSDIECSSQQPLIV